MNVKRIPKIQLTEQFQQEHFKFINQSYLEGIFPVKFVLIGENETHVHIKISKHFVGKLFSLLFLVYDDCYFADDYTSSSYDIIMTKQSFEELVRLRNLYLETKGN